MENKKNKNIVDEFGQLPIELSIWLDDNVDKVEVDISYLKQVLIRLVDLRRLAKTHLAKADIPRTVGYLLSAIPGEIYKKYEDGK